jgi:hypothetical protein
MTDKPFDPIEALKAAGIAGLPVEIDLGGENPKDSQGGSKPDTSLVPPILVLQTALAFEDGAAKYGAFNWRTKPVKTRVYIAAAQRHLSQYLDGEDIDPVSGVHHLAHASACLAIMLDAEGVGNLIDDRPPPGSSGGFVRRVFDARKANLGLVDFIKAVFNK